MILSINDKATVNSSDEGGGNIMFSVDNVVKGNAGDGTDNSGGNGHKDGFPTEEESGTLFIFINFELLFWSSHDTDGGNALLTFDDNVKNVTFVKVDWLLVEVETV